ncbi:cobalt transporter CbiM [Moorella sp. ACPs]|uniref:cobalt transporter CbiM n=1 Tax=Neomoorella carbonis TaxID=3062783 RepID=UPI003243AFEF
MHIPDGYLSPQTCAVLGAAMLPVWRAAARKVRATLKAKQVPLLAIGAAFSFTIMMYNIPIPDGTTAHATGGAILAILFGPWAAAIGLSIALAIQALFFGDGGILAFGANAFNIAFIQPFASFYVYKLLAGRSPVTHGRRVLAAGIAGFTGINLAALAAAVEFGLQPVLFHTASGVPLYSPYPLSLAVPAMALAHLLVAGPAEGIVTGLVVHYLERANPALLQLYPEGRAAAPAGAGGPGLKGLAIGLGILVLLSPLGILASGTAWGEWSPEELQQMLGFVPDGMVKLAASWSHALFPDYAVPGLAGSFLAEALGYILSALVGLGIIMAIFLAVHRFTARKEKPGANYHAR